ncbi:hypothetical protein ACROYT_G038767 [Oculina patagonica]
MFFASFGVYFFVFSSVLIKLSFACGGPPEHSSGVISLLNVTVRSEASNDPGRAMPNGLASISVNNKNYAPQTKGYNVAVFDALSGRFLTSGAFDCAASQAECDKLGEFLTGLPQDVIVLLAIQDSAFVSGKTLPTSELGAVGAQQAGSVATQTAHAVIGYKGQKSVAWKDEKFTPSGAGPAEVSTIIPISCSYVPEDSTTCTPFNIASQKYGGSCLNQSTSSGAQNGCEYVLDGTTTVGWQSASNEDVNSFITIGFHTTFIINKLRIMQKTNSGQQIQEILLEFSDCSIETITLSGNKSDFQEFTFLSRRASWVTFTVKKVYGGSGGVRIQEIEFYNDMCKQKSICDAVKLSNNSRSNRYRLHRTKFPLMIDAKDDVSVHLSSDSRDSNSQYAIIIGSDGNIILQSKAGHQSRTLMESNVTAPLLKENEMRYFWIDIEKDRVVFGSGEKIYLFWRAAESVNIKYVFLSTTTSSATFQICGRVGQCYKDALHYWPMDKSIIFVQDVNADGSKVGRIHGSWSIQEAPTKLGIAPLALSLAGSDSWVDLGDFEDSCVSSPSKCPNGISVSFKASVSGSGTGYILSSGGQSSKGLAVFYTDGTMYFSLRDGQKIWQVHGSYQNNTWQTFSMSWSQENGLTAVIVGDTATVLCDTCGQVVTPSTDVDTSFTIGRPNSKSGEYAHCVIRDVAVWEEEITEQRMSKLHVCNDPETCAQGWQYFDGSCYKIASESLAFASARNSCVAQGADLVKISSSEENTFVRDEASGETWIGLEKALDNSFYWTDESRAFFTNWKDGSPGSDDCAVMDVNGTWRDSLCSFTPSKYVCEQAPHYYLGCYEDSAIPPTFVFNPSGYKESRMTPGLCMHKCGTEYFTYAALKRGNLCLCSNSTVPANERSSDMCHVPCLGAGNLKCGGETHVSVYKSVQVRPLSLTLSSDLNVTTLTAFNVTLTPTLPADQTVELYSINVGDGTVYHTTESVATLAFLYPGSYPLQATAIVEHSKTGYRSAVESSTTVSAVSNVTDIEFFCPEAASVNLTFSCSLKFSQGANVETTIEFEEGEVRIGTVPDAEIITVGTPVADAGSQITSDGLYLLAEMEVTNKGEAVALEMDVDQGGFLDLKVYRPKCMSASERYCPSKKLCVTSYFFNNASLCPKGKPNTCDDGETFSFKEGQCAIQSGSCSENKTMAHGNFDYEHISSYLVYTTSGPKRILIESKSQRLKLEEGDVIGVRFPATGPAAALKTSLSSFSFLYSSSVINSTGTKTLRGNRLPSTEESPTKVLYVPAVAILYTAVSETFFENLYQTPGYEKVSFTVGNSREKLSFTKEITLQETITGLALKLPEALPSAEVVNISVELLHGTNVTYMWNFGDGENATTLTPWVTHLYKATGTVTVNVIAMNKVSLSALWCSVVIQERIAGMEFRDNALISIQNGSTASIGWFLRNGSHVDFNISVETTEGEKHAANLTDAKVPGATFFAIYKTNLTIPGVYLVTITAANELDSVTIKGNLSVQRAISGVVMTHPGVVTTNQTFNFTVLPHQGEETAQYFLLTMDGSTTNTTDKVISHTYHKAGRYKISLIATNDISSTTASCEKDIIVQDVIEGLMINSSKHEVAVNAEAHVYWKVSQGSEMSIHVDYGDGNNKLFNKSITVGDIFVAISMHNYSAPGEYPFTITVSNLVSNQTANTTVYVETPVQDAKLVLQRGSLERAEGDLCTGDLYVAVNDTVTAIATAVNGTNVNSVFDFGDGSTSNVTYSHRQFPENGTTAKHTYSAPGEYNVTVTLFNRNLQNATATCRVIVQYPISVVNLSSTSPQPSSPGSVGFVVSFPGYTPSGPLYINYTFGDNQTLNRLQDNNGIIHFYPGKGVYIATVQVSNQISSGNASVEVKIQDKVHGLNFSAHVTDFVNTCPEREKFFPQKGVFPEEYPIFFNASITNGTNVSYTWILDGVQIPGINCNHTFSATGNHTIQLTAANDVSNMTANMSITVEESIVGVSLTTNGPAEEKIQPVNFTLKMEKKGTDSCFKIDLIEEGSDPIYYKTGTPSVNCSSSAEPLENKPEIKFDHTYAKAKDLGYPVTLKAKNRVSCFWIRDENSKAAVVKGPCYKPIITAPGIGNSMETRTKYKRSKDIDIKTVNTIKCHNVSTQYWWNISQLVGDPTELGKKIKTDSSDLLIPARMFNYGLYELSFLIRMVYEPGVFKEEKFYIEVVESKLVATIDGGTEKTVGSNVRLEMNAEKSHDPDTLPLNIHSSGLKFAWFCMQVDRDKNYNLPTDLENLPPMPTPPPQTNNTGNKSAHEPPSLGGCFEYGPGQLNFSSPKITLNTSRMTANTTYKIRFVMMKGQRKAFADQIVIVSPGDPPTLSISCAQCEGGEKINPSNKLTLLGHGETNTNKRIDYEWKLYKCSSMDAEKCTGEPLKELKEFASTPLYWDSLVIKPNSLQGGQVYEIALFGRIPGGKWGSSKGFNDTENPLHYEFFYSTNGEDKPTIGSGTENVRKKVTLPSGLEDQEFKIRLYAKVSDDLGASTVVEFESRITVVKVTKSVAAIKKDADEQLTNLINSGNTRETASFVQSVAAVLNEPAADETKSEDEKKESIELREKLVDALLQTQTVSKETSLSDVAQLSSTLTTVTSNPEQNSDRVVNQVSNVIADASKAILAQATGKDKASSEKIKEASQAVFGGAVNLIKSADVSQKTGQSSAKNAAKNTTQKVLNTMNTLSEALVASKVPGEEPTKIETPSISLGVSRERPEDLANKTFTIGDSVVAIPENLTAFGNKTLDIEQLVSAINFYPGSINNSKLVSMSFHESNAAKNQSKFNVEGLEEGNEISVMVPRSASDVDKRTVSDKLHSSKYNLHVFGERDNSSALIIEIATEIPVDVELFVKKGGEPNPSKGVFDYNATLLAEQVPLGDDENSSISTDPTYSYRYFLSNDALNWSAAGEYFASVRYKKPFNSSLEVEELTDVPYNFSVSSYICLYYDEKSESWGKRGVKVGPNSSIKFTECLTNHLTTFGSNFFVPPNTINFKELSVKKLLESPHALIAVCVILGLYFLCLIPARRADKNDALKTGVTPLPDNDSRDTYCYEIQVHTGFIRGAGSSAEVSLVVTGALGDSEPRVLKDPKRRTFKTGAVDAFLLTVPQSLGNLKQIRVWHNNGGSYPSWNLLRIMIQDIQTDQRFWFVCDDWLAVDEGDGKIERNLFPASKKELTKFNVLFTSEVRKNLTDGHIWFSVVARPPRSTFTRVQRLTCCLSILLCTMLANAMFYRVGENETPKNAIKIMGFSFSIRQVSIGIMSSLVVFPANLIIVTIFRKAKPKENRYTVKTEHEEIDNVDVEMGEEKKKTPPKKGLPHWFIYVAYVIAFVAIATSGSFVIMYGMEFGPEKSAQWLSSMTISFLQDVLLTQPIKVFILAMLFALLIKDPKKAEGDTFADINALANDEEWLHKNADDLDPEMQKTLKTLINDKPPDEAKLEIARQLRMKEKQMKSIIREIAWYVIFLLVLLTISYGNRDLITSQVTRYMQNTFEKAAYSGNLTFDKVHRINDYWKWLDETFIPSLNPHTYYNDKTPYDSGFLADTPNAYLLGVARLRQLRIKKNTCEYKRVFHHIISECNDFYSMEEEDQGSYLPGWKGEPLVPSSNLSVTPAPTPSKAPQPKGPWVYQSGEDLKTFPYWGYKATYSAGGFVQNLPRDANDSLKITGNLSVTDWLDRYTRAIFSEFAIYNANTNLFCVVTLLFEQLPTGSFSPYPSILTLRLFRYVGGEMYFVLTCEIMYLLFSAFFVFKEIRMFVKKGREHLKNPWSIMEIFVTLLSLTAVGLYFARLKFTNDALRDMNNDHSGFVSFHYTAFLDEWLKCIIGIIVFLSFLKLFRLLRFNRRMSLLQQVLKRCFTSLMSFMFMFALAFLAFALLATLVFGQAMEGFGTFLRSCASLMDTILGKFTLKEMTAANRIIGPIFFYSYTISMVFVLINMFLSIINDAFTDVRSDVEKQSNEFEIVDFMVHRLKENIGKSMGHAIHPVYKEPKSELEVNFDKIADNADNAMHFMRNIAFEDMRKTRWFQTENCTEKKKNLMRLLMEVDWDYYEEELTDSIPVFERFLNQYSNEDLESALQHYRQKRMVEDLVYNKVNGEDDDEESSNGSGSDSDDSNDDSDGDISDDAKSSNDEDEPEAQQVAEDGTRLLTPGFGVKPNSSNNYRRSVTGGFVESEQARIRSPSLLVTDAELTNAAEMNQSAQNVKRESLCFSPHAVVSENELVKILQDVQRETESRCTTDAEIESIFGDSLSPNDMRKLKFDSEPENTGSQKKNVKKRRKKKGMTTTADNIPTGEPEEKQEKKKEKKSAKKKPKTPSDPWTGDDEGEGESEKPKKKAKEKVATEGEEENEPKKKKKKKNKVEAPAEMVTGENVEEETNEGEGRKNKKKTKKKTQEETLETAQEASEAKDKKKKKTKAKKKLTSDEDDGQSSVKSDETVETVMEGKTKKKKKEKKTSSDKKDEELQEESEC